MSRYETVLKWFEEYGWKIIKKNNSSAYWHETIIENKKGIRRTFEITNNHIWLISYDRISLGKTKTELYENLKFLDWEVNMNGETAYTRISDRDFIKLLEKSVNDTNKYCEKLQQENKQLKEQLEKEKKARLYDYKFTPEELVNLLNESLVETVKEQIKELKQKDKIINDAIDKVESIAIKKGPIADTELIEILDILIKGRNSHEN